MTRHPSSLIRAGIALAIAAASCTGQPHEPVDHEPIPPDLDDLDGDTISDVDEGRHEPLGPTDTDGDRTPDYRDEDSDNDTIPDSIEAGDDDLETYPVDTDTDAVPDFRDRDSDGNGIWDDDEGAGDVDGDGILDFRDPDNDDDGILDLFEAWDSPEDPIDFDGDGIPDMNDVDSDDDTISDRDESPHESDVDEDLVPDRHDLDTDGDGIPDSVEAGDDDLDTPPRDTDGDSTADFRDMDSDGDGLSDAWEDEHGLDPCSGDTDGDGVPDLIEVGVGTDPLDPCSPPWTSTRTLFFHVPYNDPEDPPEHPREPSPAMDIVVGATSPRKADVVLALDASGSLGGEISSLQARFKDTIAPSVLAMIPDVRFTVASFTDCAPTTCASAMQLHTGLTDDLDVIEEILDGLTGWCGTNPPYIQALHLIATGDSGRYITWPGIEYPDCPCMSDFRGWPCFRRGAVPVIVQLGDKSFSSSMASCPPGLGIPDAIEALNAIDARYIGLDSGASHGDMAAIAAGTMTTDLTGAPLVLTASADGSDAHTRLIEGIEALGPAGPLEISVRVRDDPSDDVDATVFIDRVEPDVRGGYYRPPDYTLMCAGGLETADRTGDTVADVFTSIEGGTAVCFEIHARINETVPPVYDGTWGYRVFLDVMADGVMRLDTWEVYFAVP